MWVKLGIGFLAVLIGVALLAWGSYRPLPERAHLHWKNIPVPDHASPLSALVSRMTTAHDGLSGVKALSAGREAFAMRAVLAASAGQTIDAQYYIWHNDTAGQLLFAALRDAADRGVRVRLLLDDNNTRGMDELLTSLNAHEMIEIRLFNPFMHRKWRAMGYLNDFFRLNRRMHNKSFTVDNVATVIGGRNIGDEYFEVGDGVMFADLDVLAVGSVVDDVEQDFERYWSAESVYPLSAIIPDQGESADPLASVDESVEAQAYLEEIANTDVMRYILTEQNLPLVWTSVRLISDDPAKGLGAAKEGRTVSEKLRQQVGNIRERLVLVSPYFVPTAEGTAALIGLIKDNINVEVLTNSLSATDVAVVHAGYAKYRKPLLRGGVKLYELKSDSTIENAQDTGLTGHSGSSLHAKTFAIDGERLFIGSFNLDPRSAHLNTEMGFLIDSPELTQKLETALAENISQHAYQVGFSDGELVWRSYDHGRETIFDQEPESSTWKKIQVTIFSWLPIEWLL
ncbi:phospholipase D family protein [Cardiobacteriaceae bacterium TAE3-ERU3]|nr:phospholipase D family protein [Cardiobacteriaceae bacterium TAE3-ERU3]